ncbi:MAG: hypothetical protein GXP55_19215 [Deltaproteobacteria bacterium]|nr:hypothetical protein [Deltaproteobacteria bacterium]
MSKRQPVEALRTALGELLPRDLGPGLLFEALRPLPTLPRSDEEVAALVHGSLRDALIRRAGETRGAALAERLAQRIREERPPRDADATRSMPTLRHPVPVVFVAAGDGFSDKLTASLGPKRIEALPCHDLDEFQRALRREEIALAVVDASDFAPIEPKELAEALSTLRATTARVVWSASLPYGRALIASLGDQATVSLEADEGIEPLLDLIRSRHAR